jgi:hypothetical protein
MSASEIAVPARERGTLTPDFAAQERRFIRATVYFTNGWPGISS